MAGLYQRNIDPNFATPGGISAASPNAGIGAPGGAGLPRAQEDNFDPAQLAGILGLVGKNGAVPAAAPNATTAPVDPNANIIFSGAPTRPNGEGLDPGQAMAINQQTGEQPIVDAATGFGKDANGDDIQAAYVVAPAAAPAIGNGVPAAGQGGILGMFSRGWDAVKRYLPGAGA